MPRIGFLSGLLISMFWRDHNPPHIHVYKGDRASRDESLNLIK